MSEFKIPEFTIQRARAHVEAGERLLVDAADEYSQPLEGTPGLAEAAMASAHFAAATAICDVLAVTALSEDLQMNESGHLE
jgi:hypothetical protein